MSENAPQESPEIIQADFKEKRVVERIKIDPDTDAVKFLRDMAKVSKKANVKSVMVLTVTADDHVEWLFSGFTEHHMALAALSLDDVKDELKMRIFQDETDME